MGTRKKIAAMALAAAGMLPGAAFAQPTDTWTASCALDDTLAGEGAILASLAGQLSLPFPDWESFDLDGDGISDAWQAQHVAYAVCSGNVDAETGFNANKAEAVALVAEFGTLVTWLTTNHPAITAFGNMLEASVQAPCNQEGTLVAGGPALVAAFDALQAAFPGIVTVGDAFQVIGAELADVSGDYAPFPAVLGLLTNVLAELGGQSSESQAAVLNIVPADDVADLALAMQALAGLCQFEASCLSGIPSEANQATALLGTLAGFPGLSVPAFQVLDAGAKAVGEDFAGGGDYDGDGTSNGDIANLVESASGDENDYVAGVTGEITDFWAGNPNLPVAGIFGLGAVVCAMSAAGAVVLRRRK